MFGENGGVQVGDLGTGTPPGFLGLGLGPKPIGLYLPAIARSKSFAWDGPLGRLRFGRLWDWQPMDGGHDRGGHRCGSFSVDGGGNTATACKMYKPIKTASHNCTGGGGSLELLKHGVDRSVLSATPLSRP